LALRNNHIDYSVMLCNFGASVKSDIVLKDGKSTSSFGFSLSKSLINVAYLIMNKGVLLIGKRIQFQLFSDINAFFFNRQNPFVMR
jgi:hypothetical protein